MYIYNIGNDIMMKNCNAEKEQKLMGRKFRIKTLLICKKK